MENKKVILHYFLPVIIFALQTVLSLLFTPSKMLFFLMAILLFVLIGVSIFLAEIYIKDFSPTLKQRRAAKAMLLEKSNNFDLLSYNQLLKIEEQSDEMWIYAYDLAWENKDNELTEVVFKNLNKGKKYIYIVPDTEKVRNRVEALKVKYKSIKNTNASIEFLFRKEENKLIQFGFTIYNPIYHTIRKGKPIVIFFPHYKLSDETKDTDKFYYLKGDETFELQEEFWACRERIIHGRNQEKIIKDNEFAG